MKRKWTFALAPVLALGLLVPGVANAALNDVQKQEVASLEKQILDLRKQVVQKYVEAGDLTADQGKALKDKLDQFYQKRQQNGFAKAPGQGHGKGFGHGKGKGPNGEKSTSPNTTPNPPVAQ